MKTKDKIFSILIALALICSMLPVRCVSASSKGRLVLIQNEDLTYTAYEDIVVVAPEGNIMVKINPLSEHLGYTYEKIDKDSFKVISNNGTLIFNKTSTTYIFENEGEKVNYVANHKPYTVNDTAGKKDVCVVEYSALSKLVHTKYFKKTNSERFKNLGYDGVIIYNPYKKASKLPDLSKVYTAGGESYYDIFTKYVRENNLYARRIGIGMRHTIGLKDDGTVMAAGVNYFGEKNVKNWKDIVAVDCGKLHTVGLKKDGTVVAVGDNDYGQLNTSKWKNIVAIACGESFTVGLKKDGTVVAVGDNRYGQLNVSKWKDIVAISAGIDHTVGLKSDGTVVAVGNKDFGKLNVSKWKDIVAIVAGGHHTVGLKKNGTVVAVGYDFFNGTNVKKWKDIVAIDADEFDTYGLKADGTVVTTGTWLVENMEDVISIKAGDNEIIGIKSDGSLYVYGIDGGLGYLKIEDWVIK